MSSNLETKVLADKALRDSLKVDLDTHLTNIKQGLQERGIASRIAGEIGVQAKSAFDESVEIARENPGVIAGTMVVLMLWILRNPIISWLDNRLGPRS